MEHKLLGEYTYEDMVMAGPISASNLDRVKDFKFEDDVVVVSYPKTGTTWLQEMAWLVCNNGDIEGARTQALDVRVPFLEFYDATTNIPVLDTFQNVPRPAVIKSHLPARFFRKQLAENNAKFIVIGRNPKDTLVSYYHFYRSMFLLGNFKGTWDEFFSGLFQTQRLLYGDFFKWYESWWKGSTNENVMFLKYEDMKKTLLVEVKKIADFLGKDLPDDTFRQIAEYGDFNNMKKNKMSNAETVPVEFLDPSISKFMRSGTVGDWKNYFTTVQSDIIDKMCDLHLKPKGLIFDYECHQQRQ